MSRIPAPRPTTPRIEPQTAPDAQEEAMTAVETADTAALPGVPHPRSAGGGRPAAGRQLVSPAPGGPPAAPQGNGRAPGRDGAGRWSAHAAPAGALPDTAELARRARAEQRREDHRAVRTLAGVIALACVEAEVGRRHLRDLAAWLDLPVYDKVARRIDLLERTGARMSTPQPPRPVGARVCEVAPGRVEASASIRCGDRVRAIAMRMERRLSRWRVVAVEIG